MTTQRAIVRFTSASPPSRVILTAVTSVCSKTTSGGFLFLFSVKGSLSDMFVVISHCEE